MLLSQNITSAPYQKQTLVLQDGSFLNITLRFVPLQQCWVFDEISRQDFIVQGMRCTNMPNLLRQWKNLLPFGLGCFSSANREPSLQEDFSSGASKLYILTETEVDEYEDFLSNG